VLTEGQPCSFCASFAGSETVFKKAFGIVDAVQPAEEKPAEVIAEPSESVPPVATEQLTLPLPEAVAADFAEQPQSSPVEPPTPARQDAPEPPLPEPPVAGPENFPAFLTLDRPVPRVRFSLQGGWRPWLAAAAAIVAIAAAVGWMLVDRQPAPEHLASETRVPSAPAVQGPPQAPARPMPGIDNFSFDSQSIQRGEKVTLTWSVANATDVQITPEIGRVGLKGKRILAPTQTISFTLSAKGPGGEVSQSAMIAVAEPAPAPAVSSAFSASPSSIKAGESALLEWSVSNATGVRIDPGLGARPEVGSFRVSPVETTTYTLVADSAGGETRRTVRVEVLALSPGTLKVNAKDGLKYVWIPPGSFTMGCSPGDNECYDDEKPPRHVNIAKGFWIGQTEVTQEAYQKVTGNNPSSFKGAKLPVESISWNDAQGFCQAAGMRLPTEAEWEYAARAGSTQSRYGDLAAVAWYSENSGGKTHEVAQKAANAWELYDTLGNVWEWTADWYEEGKTRALRGGSWLDLSRYARVSFRVRYVPEVRNGLIGVRCVGESL
jgi:formylglycine-generating enzyme required for sulfatase activity